MRVSPWMIGWAACFALYGCGGELSDAMSTGGSEDARSDTPDPGDGSAADGGDGQGSDSEDDPPEEPVVLPDPVAASVYGAKVKTLIAGKGLTDEELASLEGDPSTMRSLVSTWLDEPVAGEKLQSFFTTMFQQDGFEELAIARHFSLVDLNLGRIPTEGDPRIEGNLMTSFRESFGRTAIHAFENDRSFSDLVTSKQMMMTTAMMITMALNDEVLRDDQEGTTHRTLGGSTIMYQNNQNYPLSRVLDPDDNAFLKFYIDEQGVVPNGCPGGEVVSTPNDIGRRVYQVMMGFFRPMGEDACRRDGQVRTRSYLQASDFSDWRMVTVRRPRANESADRFYDVEALRGSNEMVLHTPRVGFFTTPAFLARWETNEDNQARGTLNQTLITAYGQSIDGEQLILPTFDDALDGEHADPTTTCYACHKTLDPMRQFFRRDYTYSFHAQEDESVREVPAAFAWDGVEATGETIEDFGALLATHENLATGWTQKVCWYANSAPCPENEEFDRVVRVFEDSGLQLRVLFEELLSSSLITGAVPLQDATGDLPSVARIRHVCATLEERLDEPGVCGLSGNQTALGRDNDDVVRVIPDDVFSRGEQSPVMISDVSLFVRNAYERMCYNIANRRVNDGDEMFSSRDPEAAMDEMVSGLAGLPSSDPRHAPLRTILGEHFEAANEDENDRDSLRSTFILACMAPTTIALGF